MAKELPYWVLRKFVNFWCGGVQVDRSKALLASMPSGALDSLGVLFLAALGLARGCKPTIRGVSYEVVSYLMERRRAIDRFMADMSIATALNNMALFSSKGLYDGTSRYQVPLGHRLLEEYLDNGVLRRYLVIGCDPVYFGLDPRVWRYVIKPESTRLVQQITPKRITKVIDQEFVVIPSKNRSLLS